MTTLCCRCHANPRKPGCSYCAECSRAYAREWARRNRGNKPRPVKPVVGDGEKWCSKCGRILPVERFSRNRSKSDGRMSMCKDCDAFRQTVYLEKRRVQLRPKRRATSAQWRAEHPGYGSRYNVARRIRRLRKMLGTEE